MRRHPDKESATKSTTSRSLSGGLVLLLALLGVGLLSAAPAAANYEQVDTFEEPAGLEILKRTGLAVNVNGAGGVSPGTLYEVGRAEAGGVNRYDAKGEFQGHWGGGFPSFGVAVGQSAGCVYVLRPNKEHVVSVFNADGSQEITSFGDKAAPGETIAESPQKLHASEQPAGIAVDAAGKVYVFDGIKVSESRIMVFEPGAPGSCEGYAYAGQASDLAPGLFPAHPVLDGKGNLYVVVNGGLGIREFSLSAPSTPTCKFDLAAGGIVGLAVNPTTGELFYTSEKDKKRQIHVLEPCSEGKFEEDTAAALTPEPQPAESVEAMAFNPTLQWDPSRPPGVLYGAPRSFFDITEPNYVFVPSESHEPEVEAESVTSVTSSTATLRAQINPKGASTSYVFQYLSEAAYEANEPAERFAGASEAPLGGALLGGGKDPLPAAAAISGLAPDTAYRYRVIATSPEGADEGEAQSFHTFPVEAPGLPDNRAYELVSPVQKHGGEVFPANPFVSSCGLLVECKPGTVAARFPLQSASDGNSVAYEGFPFSSTEGAPRINEYVSKRTASGWQTTNPTPSLFLGESTTTGYRAFDSELAAGLFYGSDGSTFSSEAPPGYANLLLQPLDDPLALSPLLTSPPPNRPQGPPTGAGLHLEYAGATSDLAHVLLAANDALTGSSPFAPEAVDPSNPEEEDNLYERVGGELRLVNVLPGNAAAVPGAVFGSGSKLSKDNSGGLEGPGTAGEFFGLDFSHAISDDGSRIFWSSESGQVYVRINGEETLEVKDPGKFLTASADGSKALLGDGCLYDVQAEACEDLTGGKGGFKGIIGQSEDLSSIYFVDSAALTPEEEENANGEHAEEGKKNLYSWQEGDLSFIATLVAGETGDRTDWTVAPIKRTAEASPDGRWVAFLSRASLTGADNTGPCIFNPPETLLGPCPEAFLFDSASETLVCASCDPSGELPLGPTSLPRISVNGISSLPQPRYLTDQGRLFFDTRDSLSPFDTNNGVEDVYQYEPQGIGSCKREGGCISLISAGNEPDDSNFLAMDPSGANVFFTTRDQLTLKDRDDLLDLYDARIGGGIPAETETTRPECQGESCQPAPNPPQDIAPASSSFQGSGNVREGKKAKKHAKKHARKHKRKRHAKKHAKKRAHRAAHQRGSVK
jgi:hypothetical protein